ncbi:hypothetical protein ACHAW6_006578 [Cyclotella cf. meneghiniana]
MSSSSSSAAVLQRSRRSTAGKRLGTLVGKAQQDDDLFWSHAIWSEKGGGFSTTNKDDENDNGSTADHEDESDGEASYRISDEDSQAAVDQFDSDFNESEDEEDEDEEDVEAALREEERREKRNGMSAGRELMRRKMGKRARVVGQGLNAGLVLNWFPKDGVAAAGSAAAVSSSSSATVSAPVDSAASTAAALSEVAADMPIVQTINSDAPTSPLASVAAGGSVSTVSPNIQSAISSPLALHPSQIDASQLKSPIQSHDTTPQNIPVQTTSDSISFTQQIIPPVNTTTTTPPCPPSPSRKRNLRAATLYKTIATVQHHKQSSLKLQAKQRSASTSQRNPSKRQYTQEEMILEAVQSTELENHKWLLGRKRRKEAMKEEENDATMKSGKAKGGGRLIERFYSKRGGCNTLTFFDMDRLPDIFTRVSMHHAASVGGSSIEGQFSPRRRTRSNSEGSGGKPPNGNTTSRSIAKCVITGKVARYRDPQTMLGYHDVDAYKELRRRVDAGELHPLSTNARAMKSNRKRHFPFAKDQPTMTATVKKAPSNVKVMVTQNGVPVSPPIESKTDALIVNDKWMVLPVGVPTKRGPPLPEEFLNDDLMGVDSKVVVAKETDSKIIVSKETDSKVFRPSNSAVSEFIDAPPVKSNGETQCSNTIKNALTRLSPRKPKPTPNMLPDIALSNNLQPTDSSIVLSNHSVLKSYNIVDESKNSANPNLSNTPPVTTSDAQTPTTTLPRMSSRKHKPTSKMLQESPPSNNGNNGTSQTSRASNPTTATAELLRNSNGSAKNNIDSTTKSKDLRNGNSDKTNLSNSKKIIA